MFSLRDLRFLLCSRDLDVLCAQRIIGFLISYPEINEAGECGHMVIVYRQNVLFAWCTYNCLILMSVCVRVCAYLRYCVYFFLRRAVAMSISVSIYALVLSLFKRITLIEWLTLDESQAKKQERGWRFKWREHRRSQWKICRGSAWVPFSSLNIIWFCIQAGAH